MPPRLPVRRASAPGKLFLLGEYAVLDGAPALLASVDVRATVTVSMSERGCWRLTTRGLDFGPDFGPDRGLGFVAQELGAGGELPDTMDDRMRKALRVFDAVRSAVAAAGELPAEPLDVTIDSTAFSREGGKLGLGSSAAVAVALTAALTTAPTMTLTTTRSSVPTGQQPTGHQLIGQQLDGPQIFSLADTAHRAAQGGTGSGGDVAASVYGGLISYTRGEVPAALDWPEGLSAMAVVTGRGSSTTELVARVDSYRERNAGGYRSDIHRLVGLAGQASAALGSPDAFLRLCSDYFDALAELDAHAGAGIVTERHRELREVAAGAGGVFKSSGAGGGDLGLAFSASGAPAEKLSNALIAAGADILPLRFGAEGVRVEAER